MHARLRVAAAIWFVTLLLGMPVVLLASSFLVPNISGHGDVSVVPFLILPLLPPLVAAFTTRLTSGYAVRASGHAILAAPTVLGCFAGLGAAVFVGADRTRALGFIALAALSLAGAVAGSFMRWSAPPWVVGLAVGIMMVVLAFLAS